MGTNVKFFDQNFINGDVDYTFTTATESNASFLYDRNRNTKLTSIGSSDSSNEDWVFDFGVAKTFNRIIIDNHNIKSGSIQYWNGSSYVDFSTAISWSANAVTTNYFEFTSVDATKIRLRMSTTMVANAQKFVGELLVCLELGEVSENPSSYDPSFQENSRIHRTQSAGNVFVFFGSKFTCELKFDHATEADVTLFYALKNLGRPFFVYLCGGQTSFNDVGWRIHDFYLVNYTNEFAPAPKTNILNLGTSIKLELEEV